MKTFSVLILYGVFLYVSAVPINITDGSGKTCIFGKTDLSINIKYNTSSSTMANVSVDLSNATEAVVNGTCGISTAGALLNAYFKINKQQWTANWVFTLNKNMASLTSLSLEYVLDNTTFPNVATPDKSMTASAKLNVTLAGSGKYFKCFSGVQLNVSEEVTFTQKNFQIEPFVVNGTLSTAKVECDGDKSVTTEGPTTVTSPTNVTTSPAPATTPMPPPPRPPIAMYEVKDETGKACLLADLGIVFTLFEKKSKVYEVVNATVNKDMSKCAKNTSQEATLVLNFDKDSNLTMTFKSTNGHAVLDTMSLWYDSTRLLNTTKGMQQESGTLGLKLSSDKKFYTCNASLPERLTKTSVVQLVDSRIQVFNVNGNFSKETEECAQDKKLPSAPSAANYTVHGNGKVCILAQMAVRFHILYKNNVDKKVNLTVDLPTTGVNRGGVCGNKTQVLDVSFFKDWKFEMKFSKDKADKFALTNATLVYSYNDLFVDAPLQQIGNSFTKANNSLDMFGVNQDQMYKCVKANSTLKMDNVVVDITDLYIEPFRSHNTTKYSSTVIECNADNKTSTIVPIAVGAALAGLVVIVLIAYLIGRRRSHKGYQSV